MRAAASAEGLPVWMDKRKEPRRDYFARVDIESVKGEAESFRMAGMVEDRSNAGFGIRVRNPLNVGSKVKITQAGKVYLAIVRHCGRDRDSYYLGVEIERPSDAPE